MKKGRTAVLRLIGELENEAQTLGELLEKNRLMTRKIAIIQPDEFDWAALGYTIHNIYTLLEGYFLRVAKFFENDLEPASWHKDLIRFLFRWDDFPPSSTPRQSAATAVKPLVKGLRTAGRFMPPVSPAA